MASGWMLTRGTRRWQSVDRGFSLSDHADWPGLLTAIKETQAEQILVTHGQTGPMVRWLNENGYQARAVVTQFSGENGSDPVDVSAVQENNGTETNTAAEN
jgi:putative mRNA 3-end processing factor